MKDKDWPIRLTAVLKERIAFYRTHRKAFPSTMFVVQVVVDDLAALMVTEMVRSDPEVGVLVSGNQRSCDSHIATVFGAEVHRVPQMFPSIETQQARMRFGILEDLS